MTRVNTYLGNDKLKKVGVRQRFTGHQIHELAKCSQDPIYFINKYIKIVNLDDGLIPMKTYKFQERIINLVNDNRFVIANCPRQSGKTIAYVAYIVWYILFNDAKNVVILGNKAKTARDILARVKRVYEELPRWLQQGVLEWNKTSIEIENGCKVSVDATGGSTARSGSINLLILDEFAFVPRDIADDFMKSVYPTISSGTTTKIVIVSTPNGMNLFYKMYTEAVKGENTYVPFTMHWNEVPGRDETWMKQTIKNMGQTAFDQEYGCDFQGSGITTLIPSYKLKSMVFDTPLKSFNGLDTYIEPDPEKEYVITVDVSRGQEQDCSTFSVFDISQMPYRICAKYKCNTISPMEFPNEIITSARNYNEATLLIELNDAGGEVADIIRHDYEYEHMFTTIIDKKIGQAKLSLQGGKKYKLGVVTTKSVKNTGCANLKGLIENSQLIINDFDMISELSTFSTHGVSFAAEKGATDDLVMTLVLFAWLTGQRFFKDLAATSVRNVLQKRFEESNILPIFEESVEGDRMDVLEPGDLWITEETTLDSNHWDYTQNQNSWSKRW